MSKVYIIMGVSGSGKTTIGTLLAKRLARPFYDADDFHPAANISKMKNGIPLQDDDRFPWLHTLADNIQQWSHKGAVLACSALKESYRKLLQQNQVEFIVLEGDYDTIIERMSQRSHFMAPNMLKSQFDALEVPNYGIHVSILKSPEVVTDEIMHHINKEALSEVGVFGIGVMGKSLALNMLDKGFRVSVYNRKEEELITPFLKDYGHLNVQGFEDLSAFVDSLQQPRKILLMIKAGEVIDLVLDQLVPLLDTDDIVIDGGNSFYEDTNRRIQYLGSKGLHFIGAGVSGGEKGARFGPSIMPSGSLKAYQEIKEILEAISARDKNEAACCTYIGSGGSGHFIKMIHNGIEYGEMQLLAEVCAILKLNYSQEEIITILSEWQHTSEASFLLDATIEVLKYKEGTTYLTDLILDKAGDKGTGSWSSIEAFKLGISSTVMSAAVMARYDSSQKAKRVEYASHVNKDANHIEAIDTTDLLKAYSVVRIINHNQGFLIIMEASKQFGWDLNLSEIARIWTNGCIINSKFMESCVAIFKDNETIFDEVSVLKSIAAALPQLKQVLKIAIDGAISIPCFMAAYQYFTAMTSAKLSANIIQAQRDYFGAHTYQKLNDPSGTFYHTNWES